MTSKITWASLAAIALFSCALFWPASKTHLTTVDIKEPSGFAGFEEFKEGPLKEMPRVVKRQRVYVDLRKAVVPKSDRAVTYGQAHRVTFGMIRRKMLGYGIVIPRDLKLPHSAWRELTAMRIDIDKQCGALGKERGEKFNHLWDEHASWTELPNAKAAASLRKAAALRGEDEMHRFHKDPVTGKYGYKIGFLSREDAPEWFGFEDHAQDLWYGLLFEFMGVLLVHNKFHLMTEKD